METTDPARTRQDSDPAAFRRTAAGEARRDGLAAAAQAAIRFGYRAGGIGFLVGKGTASEVLCGAAVFAFPRMPKRLTGFVNLRGVVVPVVDLPALVTGDAPTSGGRFLMVLERGPGAVALPIDHLPVTLNGMVPAAGVLSCPPHLRGFLRGVMLAGRQHWHELDHRCLARQAMND